MWLVALAALVAASALPEPGTPLPDPSFSVKGARPKEAPATLRGVFCRSVGPASAPVEPVGAFPDDASRVHVVLSSDGPLRGYAWFEALEAPGAAPGRRSPSVLALSPETPVVMAFEPPREGFFPGRYALVVELEGGVRETRPFLIVPQSPIAEMVDRTSPPSPGTPFTIDVARAVLGGQVTSDVPKSTPATLIVRPLPGGRSGSFEAPSTGPADIVFTLPGVALPNVVAVTIDNGSWSTNNAPWDKRAMPRHVEVWTSATADGEDFVRVGGGRLQHRWGEQRVNIPAQSARRVKLRILSNYSGPLMVLSAVRILATEAEAFLATRPPLNIAAPDLGGRVLWTTSGGAGVVSLFDGFIGKAGDRDGWSSTAVGGETAAYLPQEIVLAFDRGQRALVDHIALHGSGFDGVWPRVVAIDLSDESPIDGFREVARATLPKTAGPHRIAIGQEARFVKVRLLANHGGPRIVVSELEVIEGRRPGYVSVLARPEAENGTVARAARVLPPSNENEPNDARARARSVALGEVVRGTSAETDVDVLRLTVPSEGSLTAALTGEPDIRTALTLFDGSKPIGHHAPGDRAPWRDTFTWPVAAGEHWLEIRRAPSSVVLVWDTSGSMSESRQDLEAAVNAFIDTVLPSERVNLIRFARDVEPLLPAFTSDRAALHAAVRGKFPADGSTSLYDALARAIALLGDEAGHRSIVLMTDGSDSSSRLSSGELWRLVGETRVRIYAIGLGHDLTAYATATGGSGDHVLRQLAHATGGRALFSENSKDLKAFYGEIGRDLRAAAHWSLALTASAARGALEVVATGERLASVQRPADMLFVLDASGSMKRLISLGKGRGMRPMIDVAKEALAALVDGLPAEARVGLRIYGHRTHEGRAGDCTDSELAVPLGPLDKKRVLGRIATVQALGTTPIAYSLAQLASDLRGKSGEHVVVLLTDGLEECRGDPAKEVAKLRSAGLKLRLEIIGFGLRDSPATRAMTALAESTGGHYRKADDATALAGAMAEALTVHWHVFDASRVEIARGALGDAPVPLAEGHYRVVVDTAGQPIVVHDVVVRAAQTTRIALQKEGDALRVEVE